MRPVQKKKFTPVTRRVIAESLGKIPTPRLWDFFVINPLEQPVASELLPVLMREVPESEHSSIDFSISCAALRKRSASELAR